MEFSWKTSFLLLILVSVLFQTSNQFKYFYVHGCPSTEQSWKQRSEMLNCTVRSSFTEYHCLLTSENRLIELCYHLIAFAPKGGCPYFSMDNGLGILLRERIGNRSGCPEAISNKSILTSEVYKFPTCLTIPGKRGDKEESTIHVSTAYTTAEKDVTTKAKEIRTRHGNIATVDGLFFSIPVLLLGGGIVILVCFFIGCLDSLKFKRITRLLQREESTNDISPVTCNASGSNPYQQSENETTHDYAYTENETFRPVSETASYLEPSAKCETYGGQINQSCDKEEEYRNMTAAINSRL